MSFFSNRMQVDLKWEFLNKGMLLDLKKDHVLIQDSKNSSEEKIRNIIRSLGYTPLILKDPSNEKFTFTVVPYRIPDFFKGSLQDKNYFSKNEISHLLKEVLFVEKFKNKKITDKWEMINLFRHIFKGSLNEGLSVIISKYIKLKENPIVEIGSGIGYTFSKELSAKMIRIQPDVSECHLLSRSISTSIHNTDIEGFCTRLVKMGKKISLFFALNVFDTMSPKQRKNNLHLMSQLQNAGDNILIMLDSNPHLNDAIDHLKTLHPGHEVLPYYPLSKDDSRYRFSVILVPLKYLKFNLGSNINLFLEIAKQDSQAFSRGDVSESQRQLHEIQKIYNLKVVALEEFFILQIKKELKEVGYKTNEYYHTSFVRGKGEMISYKDLIYREASDVLNIREWSV